MPTPSPESQSAHPRSGRIVAVVVTFNRLDLLRGLMERLRRTPGLAEIVVVDNASTDGTGEWLASAVVGPGSVPVHGVTLADNRGGAGGFHEGMRIGLEHDAELLWLMDDDGMPDDDCLARLLEHRSDLDFWGPVVVDKDDPERLVFPIRLPGGTKVVHAMADVRRAATGGRIDDIVIPFNGVLVTRGLAERIGLPRAEFFIWGDDHEFRLRAEEAGARIATVVDATVRHPSVGSLGTPMMFGRTTYNHSPSDLKHYCMARNNVVNLRTYRGLPHVAAFVAKTVWFYAFTRPSLSRLGLSARGIVAGLRNDFTGHGRFLA
ncbi:glycosyl transferase [Nocardioides sp. Soil797]|nr:glycosyl transferase [Nocardioides sp. Soil797]